MIIQLAEQSWSYEGYLEKPPSKDQRAELHETAKNFAKELAKAAFFHMRSLVIHANKDGTKGTLTSEDTDSVYIYGPKNQNPKDVGAVAYTPEKVLIATNSTVPDSGLKEFEAYYGKTIEVVGSSPLGSNAPCTHAEMKLYRTGGVEYIGVSKLCCLYCAAQLLAAGFTGFRGCSMVAFNNYQWLPEISDRGFRRRLWGEEVAERLDRAPTEIINEFVRLISQGSTLMQGLQASQTLRADYSTKKHPLSDVYPEGF